MASRILVVDSDTASVETARMALSRDPALEVAGVTSIDDAKEILERSPVAVLLVRAKMIEGDLLMELRRAHPTTVRLVVATQSERDVVSKNLSAAHQFLPRPYHNDLLRMSVQRAISLSEMLAQADTRETITRLDKLPESAGTYREIDEAIRRRGATTHDVARIVERDPALTAKLLQIVNSAYFGINRKIVRMNEAVSFLGMELVKSVAMSLHVCAMFGDRPRQAGFSLELEQQQAIQVAKLAHSLLPRRDLADLAYTAGLLHGIGRLVLAMSASRQARKIDHAIIGGHLLGLWGLPEPIVEAVAFHRAPHRIGKKELGVVAAVHIASALVAERMFSADELDHDFVNAIGCAHRLHEWRRAAA